jgi:deoxyribodipyrimidine photolyase-related protein
VSSAAYIDRMSDYCKGCHYDNKAGVGDRACPFNALYWDFFERHRERLSSNPRLGMVYRQLANMSPAALLAVQDRADGIRAGLEDL